MQHHDGRRVRGDGTDHAVFEIGGADGEEAGGGEGCHVCCYLRMIEMLTRVVPANAGTHSPGHLVRQSFDICGNNKDVVWVPAFAGTTTAMVPHPAI